jgi:hypothetical protein
MMLGHDIVGLTFVGCTYGGRDASRLARSVRFDRGAGLGVIAARLPTHNNRPIPLANWSMPATGCSVASQARWRPSSNTR